MPTNRTRRTRKIVPSSLSEAMGRYLRTGESEKGDYELFMVLYQPEKLLAVWDRHRDEVMSGWISDHPCSRPFAWWECDAEKEPVKGWAGERFDSPQRRRLGGSGLPSHDTSCAWSGFDKGIPASWDPDSLDPGDPPVYESEAAYLQRHGLLSETEKRYLAKHAEKLSPEIINFENE